MAKFELFCDCGSHETLEETDGNVIVCHRCGTTYGITKTPAEAQVLEDEAQVEEGKEEVTDA